MARKKKNVVEEAKTRGFTHHIGILSSEKRLPPVEPATERAYKARLNAWYDFAEKQPTQVTPYDQETLERFVLVEACALEGIDDLAPCVETVRNYFRCFCSAWRRAHTAIPRDLTDSILVFIKGPLKEKLKLLLEKRVRRFPHDGHLQMYAELLWGEDFYLYQMPSTRLDDWAVFLANVFCTARIGEFIQSSARDPADGERGLFYKVLIHGVL
ncbi:unnamed protein product [Clonostachys chloroleuca]|uniref:Uncharacterized protein n=1 Tax=Clonostachys chloroleuca TaxID=1926264 RepID=A0AA35PVH8_9HYPO|nr:unnamed protein product [Clonostachys chloroleuca]